MRKEGKTCAASPAQNGVSVSDHYMACGCRYATKNRGCKDTTRGNITFTSPDHGIHL